MNSLPHHEYAMKKSRHLLLWFCGIASLTCPLLGCGASQPEEIPPTFPVRGRVTHSDGQPLSDGMVHFQSLENRAVTMSGLIGTDGEFTIETFVVGDRAKGAIEGRHRVTILPNTQSDLPSLPTVLPEPVVIVAGENQFDFVIERIPN